MMTVEVKNNIQENLLVKELETVAENMTSKEKEAVANKISDADGRYTSTIEGLIGRYKREVQNENEYFDTKNPIFQFSKNQDSREGINNGDAAQLWEIINSELLKLVNIQTEGVAMKTINKITVTGMKKLTLGSSQIYLVLEGSGGKEEKRFVNSVPGIGENQVQQYLYPRNIFKDNGELDITAAFNNDVMKGFSFEKSYVNTTGEFIYWKHGMNDVNERVAVEPYQFYTEYALKNRYPGFSDNIMKKLNITDTNSLIGNTYRFGEGGKVYINGRIQKDQQGKDILTDEEFYICQATKTRLEKGLPAYTGTIKDLEGNYKYVPVYKNRYF